MNGVLDKLGGTFLCVLTLVIVCGGGFMIHEGSLSAPIGLGFIAVYLGIQGGVVKLIQAASQLKEHITAAKSDLRMTVVAHGNDLRQHIGRADSINEVSRSTVAGLAQKLDSRPPLRKPQSKKGNP